MHQFGIKESPTFNMNEYIVFYKKNIDPTDQQSDDEIKKKIIVKEWL